MEKDGSGQGWESSNPSTSGTVRQGLGEAEGESPVVESKDRVGARELLENDVNFPGVSDDPYMEEVDEDVRMLSGPSEKGLRRSLDDSEVFNSDVISGSSSVRGHQLQSRSSPDGGRRSKSPRLGVPESREVQDDATDHRGRRSGDPDHSPREVHQDSMGSSRTLLSTEPPVESAHGRERAARDAGASLGGEQKLI